TVRWWDAATGRQLRQVESGASVLAVALSPDGKLVASCGGSKAVSLWDGTTGATIRKLPLPEDWGMSVAFAPDGKALAVGTAHYGSGWDGRRGRLLLLDVATGKVLRQLTEGDFHP